MSMTVAASAFGWSRQPRSCGNTESNSPTARAQTSAARIEAAEVG